MTFSCSGIGVTPGIAIGEAHLLQRGFIEVSPRFVPLNQITNEIDRYRQAVANARRSLNTVEKKIPKSTWSEIASFVDTHLLMLADAALSEVPIDFIRNQSCAAEWALQLQRDALIKVFDAMDDPYLRSRKDDVDHVISQIQKFLIQKKRTNILRICRDASSSHRTWRLQIPFYSNIRASLVLLQRVAVPCPIPPFSRAAWESRPW